MKRLATDELGIDLSKLIEVILQPDFWCEDDNTPEETGGMCADDKPETLRSSNRDAGLSDGK